MSGNAPSDPSNAASSEPPSEPSSKRLPNQVGGLVDLLGIELDMLTADRVTASLEITPDHHQPAGYLHGGVSVSMGETVCSIGAYLSAPDGMNAFGMEINANHVRSKRAGTLRAVAEPLHTGRTSQVWSYRITDEDDRLVSAGRCTIAVVDASD